jgi:tetratricopeptide (TPR) repeat protein
MTRIAFAALLLLLPCALASGQWLEDPALDALVQEGIRATYDVRFDAAERAFQSVIRSRPDHPAGYFFDAMVEWWRILIDIDDESRDARFYRKLQKVIDMCDVRLDANENDLTGLFFKGGAIGFRGRLLATRKSWVKAANDGREALPIVQAAGRLAPRNADIALGLGIYNYYADVLPDKYPVLKPLMLFLPSGNRARGIQQLRFTASTARYANWEAMSFLVQLYAGYENKPSSALPFARLLADEFPGNPVFHRSLGRIHVKLGDWPRAAAVFGKVLDRCRKGLTGYNRSAEREASYYLGYDAMLRKDYADALRHFGVCDDLSLAIDRDEVSGFRIMALLRSGMTLDLLGRRADALRAYDRVLALRDNNGSQDLARQYRRAPYTN